jgi:hypothetical protein
MTIGAINVQWAGRGAQCIFNLRSDTIGNPFDI